MVAVDPDADFDRSVWDREPAAGFRPAPVEALAVLARGRGRWLASFAATRAGTGADLVGAGAAAPAALGTGAWAPAVVGAGSVVAACGGIGAAIPVGATGLAVAASLPLDRVVPESIRSVRDSGVPVALSIAPSCR